MEPRIDNCTVAQTTKHGDMLVTSPDHPEGIWIVNPDFEFQVGDRGHMVFINAPSRYLGMRKGWFFNKD